MGDRQAQAEGRQHFPEVRRRRRLPGRGTTSTRPGTDGTPPEGASAPPTDITLTYPDGAAQATENVSALWRADLADASAFLRGRFDPRAWGDASLRWLVDPGRMPEHEPAHGVRIGMGDVARFRATVDMFAEMETGSAGGTPVRPSSSTSASMLTDLARPVQRRRGTRSVRRRRRGNVARRVDELRQRAHERTRPGLFVQALALAQAGNDRCSGRASSTR